VVTEKEDHSKSLIVEAPLSGLPFADDLYFTSRILEGAQSANA